MHHAPAPRRLIEREPGCVFRHPEHEAAGGDNHIAALQDTCIDIQAHCLFQAVQARDGATLSPELHDTRGPGSALIAITASSS
jgi:hypothetical protein